MSWRFFPNKKSDLFRQIWLTRRLLRPWLRSVLPEKGRFRWWRSEYLYDWPKLGGGFKYFLFSTPTWGNDPFWLIFFKGGWNHLLVMNYLIINNYPRSYDLNILWLTMAFCFGRNYPMAWLLPGNKKVEDIPVFVMTRPIHFFRHGLLIFTCIPASGVTRLSIICW